MSANKRVFSPFKYFGGKQLKVKHILPYFPMHNTYVEPFFGGGALFFAKKLANVNAINDIKKDVVNFYEVLRDKERYDLLMHKLTYTPYAVETILQARHIIDDYKVNSVDFAWAFFVLQELPLRGINDCNTLLINLDLNRAKNFANKIEKLKNYIDKLKNTYILNKDALAVIEQFDAKDTFFYCDPPYIDTAEHGYLYYDHKEYTKLITLLSKIKGKFILSGYDNKYANSFGFNKTTFIVDKNLSGKSSKQTECLWSNFPLIHRPIK